MPDDTQTLFEWQQFSRRAATAKSGRPVKQVRLLADNDVRAELVAFLRQNKVRVKTVAELGRQSHPDESHVQLARKLGHVLLTNDRDLWDEDKHSTQGCPGILFLDVPKEQLVSARYALGRCIHCLFRPEGADWWLDTKVRVTADTMYYRYRCATGWNPEVEIEDPGRGERRWRVKPPPVKKQSGKRRQ